MKTILPRTALALGVAALLAACASAPLDSGSPAPVTRAEPVRAASIVQPVVVGSARADGARAAAGPTGGGATPDHLDPNSPLMRGRIVHFEFDTATLDAANLALVERHAGYMRRMPALNVRVEGHADERGGSEYNLSLGQRRAEAVRENLQLLGIPAARIETISWGETKPLDPGHDARAWAENRRAELHYPGGR